MHRNLIIPLGIAWALLPTPAHAQVLRGVLVDSATSLPIDAAFVVLLGASGVERARILTDGLGRFVLRAPEPGGYRLKSERIGYRSVLSPLFQLGDGSEIEYQLRVPAAFLRLPTITVEGDRTCLMEADLGPRTARLWDEARKALSAVVWTTSAGMYRYETVSFEQELDRRLRMLKETRSPKTQHDSPPYGSIPSDSLLTHGFVHEDAQGDLYFYGPDAEVFFSELFLETHCLRMAEGGSQDEGMIGLGFEPKPGRTLPDIRGVLWLDAETAELRHIDFQYENLDLGVPADNLGGRIEFLRLPSAAWIVRRWFLRTPALEAMQTRLLPRGRVEAARVPTRFRVYGGEVTGILTRRGVPVFDLAFAIVAGAAFDSTRSAPLVDARVDLLGTGFNTRTDLNGRFHMSGVEDGEYTIRFAHPRLDLFGIRGETLVHLRRGAVARTDLHIPSLETLFATICPADSSAGLVGVVRRADNREPVPNAEVSVLWSVAAAEGTTVERRVAVTARADGGYTVCDLPPDTPLVAEVVLSDGSRQRRITRSPRRGFLELDMWVVRY